MNHLSAHTGVAPQAWLQHHVPWLGLFALMMAVFRLEGGIGFDPDERNG